MVEKPSDENMLCFNFGRAIEFLKDGARVARTGWLADGTFIYYVPENRYPVYSKAASKFFGKGEVVPYHPYLALRNTDGTVSTWLPNILDVFACDWIKVPE